MGESEVVEILAADFLFFYTSVLLQAHEAERLKKGKIMNSVLRMEDNSDIKELSSTENT